MKEAEKILQNLIKFHRPDLISGTVKYDIQEAEKLLKEVSKNVDK